MKAKSILVIIAALALPRFSMAQIPDKFENLQVLPKDISKGELVEQMKQFTWALGVRCQHCHVAENEQDLSTFTFNADDKEAKNIARTMLKMTRAINGNHLSKVQRNDRKTLEVTCMTCHHGQARPEAIEDILLRTATEKSGQEAISKYRQLREANYGNHSYDFSEHVLYNLGQTLAKSGHMDAAIDFLNLNLEFYPKSAFTHFVLAEIYFRQKKAEQAETHYRKTLELDNRNSFAKKRLESLKQQKK